MLSDHSDLDVTHNNYSTDHLCAVEDRTGFEVLLACSVCVIHSVRSLICPKFIDVNCMKLGKIFHDALRALFRKPVTVQYLTKSGEMVPVPERYRGKIVYDREACIGCLLCVKICPSGAITTTKEMKVAFNMARCIFCGQCAETCPKDAIQMSSDFEMVVHEKEKLIAE